MKHLNNSYNDQSAGCIGKASFANPQTARRAAQRGNRNKDKTLNVYRCPFCSKHHVGTPRRA
jgi:hypothetical protein